MANSLSDDLIGLGTAPQLAKQIQDKMGHRVSVPASAGATGTVGQYAVASGFVYFCVAANTWERVAIATWP